MSASDLSSGVRLRYRASPDAEPVGVEFDPMQETARIVAFLERCAARLGLRPDDEPAAEIETRIKLDAARYAERHR